MEAGRGPAAEQSLESERFFTLMCNQPYAPAPRRAGELLEAALGRPGGRVPAYLIEPMGEGPLSAWNAAPTVDNLCCDSRRADAASVFFCVVGKRADGHGFARAAYEQGCRVFVCERAVELPGDALLWLVPDSRLAMAAVAAELHGHPERRLRLIGLTGTKGKTTTALLIRHMLEAGGIPTGYIGTNGMDFGTTHLPTANSTPESLVLYEALGRMVAAGMAACVLEVSSQGLWMERTAGLCFDTVLFSNLSRDHIGGVEHPDFEHYRATKRRLFSEYASEAAITNLDDPEGQAVAELCRNKPCAPAVFGVSTSDGEEPLLPPAAGLWQATGGRPDRLGERLGMSFTLIRGDQATGERWFVPLPGLFNVTNALQAAAVACECFGVAPEVARRAMEAACIPGRFQVVTHPGRPGVSAVIDYAHNGASLAAILDALRAYRPGRLIALFGSVGERTEERRRDLALAAAHRADLCIITSDNPGQEDPEKIIREIRAAFPEGSCPTLSEPDRAAAIRRAVALSRPGDILLLAGKGHEDYQLIGREKLPFSEEAILLEAFDTLPDPIHEKAFRS